MDFNRFTTGQKDNSKWVFKVKETANGDIERYKARFVAKGYSQIPGVDFDETFSPVVRHSSLRTLLALAAKLDLDIEHMDVRTAFLYGDLHEEIYIRQPEGYVKKGEEAKVCKLKKAIYGLKQAPRVWYQKLDTTLRTMNLKKSEYEQCIYYRIEKESVLIVAVYVDDLIIFSNRSNKYKQELKTELMNRFKMRDLGELSWCLGMRVKRDRKQGTITTDQSKYAANILKKFGMEDCNPVAYPIEPGLKLQKCEEKQTEEEELALKRIPYQQAVGSLLYLSQGTRPDIAYAVGVVSRFNSSYRKIHWEAVKRILRYIKGTINTGLIFKRSGTTKVEGFCDADYASDLDQRRSTTGYVFKLAGAAVSWNTKLHQTVALSTTEAEYMALSTAAQEAMYLQGLLSELCVKHSEEPVSVFCDNRGAVALSHNGVYHARTKHIDVRHHYIRQLINAGKLTVKSVSTDKQEADFLTKALPKVKHQWCSQAVGLSEFTN